ncbi:MaoC/PaaZ C-terminal domain-containing protein [Desulfallas thermosapovorans]|uniref:Acyl dehydratase n=1 Tax=Desulfallas thermosapovorans DSM 6562 TaxID=1121431 RepID=A0A5S4ZVB5_9FIRM|nr:MaoC/PaaZ C-terminal domain-containing protein [Desulfallas thermosapovorans]TYO96944.1 acyl dehydratase [Desulfallas thermosapovorans DSM 6562]
MLSNYFDDLKVGDRWVSRGRTITETDIVMFAAFSGDWYQLHTDREWAAETSFGQRIAHGLLVLSVSSGFWDLSGGTVIAFYGMDKVRFTAPTFIGDTIHAELEVVGKQDKGPDSGVVDIKQEIKNQRGQVVAVAVLRLLLKKRTG